MTGRRPTAVGSALAVLVAAAATGLLGWTAGAPWATLAGLAAVAVLVGGSELLSGGPATNIRRSWGSVAFVVGFAGVAAVLVWAALDAPVLVPSLLGTTLAGLGGTGSLDARKGTEVRRVGARSRDVLALSLAGAVLVAVDLHVAVAFFAGVVVEWVRGGLLPSLTVLSALVGLALSVVPRTQRSLGARREETFRVRPGDRRLLPLWAVLFGVFLAAATVPRLLDPTVASVPVFGPALLWTLTNGLLHAVVGAVVVVGVAVLGVSAVYQGSTNWLSARPSRAAARTTGAATVTLLAAGATVFAGELSVSPAVVIVGTSVAALACLLLPLAGVAVTTGLSGTGFVGRHGVGALLGAVGVGLGGVVAAVQGVTPLVVFVAIAAAVLVYDLGEHAASLGERVGRAVDTVESEAAHAAGSLGVGAVGVVLAAVVAFLAGSVSVPAGDTQSGFAVALALCSVLAFLVALGRGVPDGE
jgi:hypothetical protein